MTTTELRAMTPIESARHTMLREKFAGRADVLLELEQDIERQLSRPAPPACPAWCTESNHDGFGELPGTDVQMQVHSGDVVPGVDVLVCIDEYRDADDVITYGTPYIHNFGTVDMLDAEKATALGQALLTAAAKLREIGGAA